MTTQPSPSPSRPRHPFEDVVGTGRIVALGDPADESITLPVLSLAGFGPAPAAPFEKEKEKECGGAISLTRKVSARFGKRRRAGTNAATVVQSDAEAEDWSREKERVGMRAVGMSPAAVARLVVADQSPSANRNRMSRHLSIEDFSHLVQEGGIRFEMETGVGGREKEKGKNRGSVEKERVVRTRLDSTVRRDDSRTRLDDSRLRRDDSRSRRDDLGSRRDDSRTRREMPGRSASTPNQGSVESRSTGTVSPENTKASGGMLWRLVKKMSTGTLKEKRSSQSEKVPPVPPLPSALPSSRRSSIDYGEEVRPELTQFRAGSTNSAHSSRPNTIHQSSTDLSHHHRSRLTLVEPTRPSPSRPSMSHTNDSSVLSSSPKSSFGRTQSPRTSISSYVDVGDDMPPPLPLSVGMQPVASTVTIKQPTLVGKHIVSPGELAQYHQQAFPSVRDLNVNPSPSLSSPSLPPPKRPRKPRDKTPLPASPMPTPDSTPVKPKSKPNLLRRPTIRVDDETGSSSRTRSPRSASMGLPSPRSANSQAQSRSRSRTQSEAHPPSPRPRSSSMGTVFTFRELGEKKKLSEQEKVDKFEQLLEASDKAGGTLHARLQERMLLSDSMRMSDAGSVRSGM
ncbi:hypothetical protein FRC09_007058 [Ceratobasidium sp. 395]|nr:hypothetical protein FRC09_007058 [Ceratobasidium sp. 395]